MAVKKLIEVALPLEKINAESAREKSIRHGHPSTLHLWWARRPLATARAVIWASLVDDPSSHPEEFPTEEDQAKERERLFRILEDLVVWENSNNEDVLNKAKAEIMKSTNGNPPALLDPFAGGGAIPLEAQRLGLEAHAHDLNPVAVMINKAMIEIPPHFADLPPVNPEAHNALGGSGWTGAKGLAEDVRYYGEWMKQEAFKKIGHLYPKVEVPKELGGGEATVIAWIWTRTVKCPNPACGCEMPMASSFVLSKKKGNEAWVEPIVHEQKIDFGIHYTKCPSKEKESNKLGRGATFKCPVCGEVTTDSYVKQKGKSKEIGSQLMAIVAEGKKGRVYLPPNEMHITVATCDEIEDGPSGSLPENPRWFSPPAFGMTDYSDLFTNRQLTALTTFSDLVAEAQAKAEEDALAAGMADDGVSIADGGSGAKAYGEAIAVYLAFATDRLANRLSTICPWNRIAGKIEQTFGRQAIPMTWDFAEANIFSTSTGSWSGSLEWIPKSLELLPADRMAEVRQFDAQSDCGLRSIMVSTDPPYYDNIGYADLSDYFYVWMRRSLKTIYPKIFRTMLVPKAEELIATPYRHDGNKEAAREFFESGMLQTCRQIYKYAKEDVPVTIYYAYKQSETDISTEKTASTGWETMLNAIIQAGFSITGTWPTHTERETGLKAAVNALATSVVLVCRKRSEDAPFTTRRNFINELKRELRPALKKLQQSNLAPVDLAQSSIGPGMGIFSKYSKVLESDGSSMTVRSALQAINQEIETYFNEQDGELDSMSQFCVALYTQHAFNDMKYGDANTLAVAKNISIATLEERGVLYAQKGVVRLLDRAEIPEYKGSGERIMWLLTQQLTRAMETGGVKSCAEIVSQFFGSAGEQAKALAYRLYTIAEKKGWAQEAYAYNALVVSWPDIKSMAAELSAITPEQVTLF